MLECCCCLSHAALFWLLGSTLGQPCWRKAKSHEQKRQTLAPRPLALPPLPAPRRGTQGGGEPEKVLASLTSRLGRRRSNKDGGDSAWMPRFCRVLVLLIELGVVLGFGFRRGLAWYPRLGTRATQALHTQHSSAVCFHRHMCLYVGS